MNTNLQKDTPLLAFISQTELVGRTDQELWSSRSDRPLNTEIPMYWQVIGKPIQRHVFVPVNDFTCHGESHTEAVTVGFISASASETADHNWEAECEHCSVLEHGPAGNQDPLKSAFTENLGTLSLHKKPQNK